MWKNSVEPDRPQMKIWRMRIACWIPETTNTHSHSAYVILIAIPLQQLLHERASVLRCTCIGCLVTANKCVHAGWNTVAPLVLHLRESDQLWSLSRSSVRIKEGGNPQEYECDRIKMAYSWIWDNVMESSSIIKACSALIIGIIPKVPVVTATSQVVYRWMYLLRLVV